MRSLRELLATSLAVALAACESSPPVVSDVRPDASTEAAATEDARTDTPDEGFDSPIDHDAGDGTAADLPLLDLQFAGGTHSADGDPSLP